MLTEPNSLSARILQAVYYPNGSILDPELGSHPSQIWRSILGGRDILVQGLLRRIGDGRSTNIWADNWLPHDFMMKPLVSRMINPPQMVSVLIDETMATWKTKLVHACFLPMDAAIILGIPLCTRRQSDFWAWSLDRKGQFSVKSAYRMISSIKSNRENYYERNRGSSNTEADSKAWCSLCKTSVPSKIRVFLWRLAQPSLPTADVLEHQNISRSSICGLCVRLDSWKHSILECNMANSVWALSDDSMVEHMHACGESHAQNWLFHMLETLSHDHFIKLTVTLWAIWTVRRKAIHERKSFKARCQLMVSSLPSCLN
jgi:hypothetical protein